MKKHSTALKHKLQQGFTLIELLVVIGILAVLLAIVLIAINPARQFAQANDTQRASDVNAVLNAVHQYMIQDNAGIAPTEIPADDGDPLTDDSLEISDTGADICALLVPDYIAALPADPTANGPVSDCTGAYSTGYSIVRTAEGRITVSAVGQNTPVISVTR